MTSAIRSAAIGGAALLGSLIACRENPVPAITGDAGLDNQMAGAPRNGANVAAPTSGPPADDAGSPDVSPATHVISPASLDELAEGTRAPAPKRTYAPAERVEGTTYRLILESLKGCKESTGQVGFFLQFEGRKQGMFVSPRDFSLESGGVILQPAPATDAGTCLPKLPPGWLKPGQKVRGFVLFQVPPSFRQSTFKRMLAYQPTRWGGAARIEITLPACLEGCAPAATVKKNDPSR